MAVSEMEQRLHECAVEEERFLEEVVAGLQETPKLLPCKYFYDQHGSQLFDRICTLEEYYPTRTECALMERYAGEMATAIGEACMLIEYGSGSSIKTRILLEALDGIAGYVPVDISREHLLQSVESLQQKHPHLKIHPVWADYTSDFSLPDAALTYPHRVVYFPGSTIGNFHHDQAEGFLRHIAELVGLEGGALIGVDLKKDHSILERAYNDAEGVTAAFNMNLLQRVNNELDGDFDLDSFEHEARYDAGAGRIEMHLVSQEDQGVRIGDAAAFTFVAGESIRTECSYKYSLPEFAALAERAGMYVDQVWTDDNGLFSVQRLKVAA